MHLLLLCEQRPKIDFVWWMRYVKQSDVRWNLFHGLCDGSPIDESSIREIVALYQEQYEEYLKTFEIEVESYWQSSVCWIMSSRFDVFHFSSFPRFFLFTHYLKIYCVFSHIIDLIRIQVPIAFAFLIQ